MKTFEEVKEALGEGRCEAIIRKVARAQTGDESRAEEVLRGVLAGDLRVVLVENAVKLVGSNGRCIPVKSVRGMTMPTSCRYTVTKPSIDLDLIHGRLTRFFGPKMQFVSVGEFKERTVAIIAELEKDKQTSNLLKGAYLPLCFPHLEIEDYGRSLEEVFLPAAECSVKASLNGVGRFDDRIARADRYSSERYHMYTNGLAGRIEIVQNTHHEKLVEAMGKGPVVGIWFANPLQGFSVQGCRRQIMAFQDRFALSGVIDNLTAFVADPEILDRDEHGATLDCAAVELPSSDDVLTLRNPCQGYNIHNINEVVFGLQDGPDSHIFENSSGSILVLG